MPKIAAGSIPEHVARQEAAVVDAAIRLFNERGVHDVTLADIAKEVGLARNSLYRYFPDKAHLLALWFRMAITPLVEASDAIAAGPGSPSERLARWVDTQFEFLTAPEQEALLVASGEMSGLTAAVRDNFEAGHQQLYGSLGRILADCFDGRSGRHRSVVAGFLAAIVRSAAEQVRGGADVDDVRAELHRLVDAVL